MFWCEELVLLLLSETLLPNCVPTNLVGREVLIDVFLVGLNGKVGGTEGDVHEEGLFLLGGVFHEVRGVVADDVRLIEVVGAFDGILVIAGFLESDILILTFLDFIVGGMEAVFRLAPHVLAVGWVTVAVFESPEVLESPVFGSAFASA